MNLPSDIYLSRSVAVRHVFLGVRFVKACRCSVRARVATHWFIRSRSVSLSVRTVLVGIDGFHEVDSLFSVAPAPLVDTLPTIACPPPFMIAVRVARQRESARLATETLIM